jgi:signal peptidase I
MKLIATSKRYLHAAWQEVKGIVLALTLVLIAQTVAAQPFSVPTSSMVPTILVGDEIIANKFVYGYSKYSAPFGLMPDFKGRIFGHTPERGDVIVFKLPRDTKITYVKRLIGLPGDRIQMKSGRLYINGEIVPRRDDGGYTVDLRGNPAIVKRYVESLPTVQGNRDHEILEISDSGEADNTQEFTVPAGHYFMMGDNRDNSLDSRFPASEGGVGFVPAENLIGRADRVLLSRNLDIPWWDVPAWPKAFRARFLASIS